eukprot:jgi/Botrbrau1/10822/Bobra.0025s0001.1
MSAVEVAICHMHSDHLQSEAIGSMWAAEEVHWESVYGSCPPPTCLAHSGTPLSKFERTNNEKYLLHTHMHTVSAS